MIGACHQQSVIPLSLSVGESDGVDFAGKESVPELGSTNAKAGAGESKEFEEIFRRSSTKKVMARWVKLPI